MYYKQMYNSHFTDSSFRSYLRASDTNEKSGNQAFSFTDTPKKNKLNIQQQTSYQEELDTKPISSLKKKYEKKIEGSLISNVSILKGENKHKKTLSLQEKSKGLSNVNNSILSPSSKKKLEFYYGSNPLEILSEEKMNQFKQKENNKNAIKGKRVNDYLGSSGMKLTLNTDSKAYPNAGEGKVTSTPKSLLQSTQQSTKSHNRKKNVTAFDSKDKRGFYYY